MWSILTIFVGEMKERLLNRQKVWSSQRYCASSSTQSQQESETSTILLAPYNKFIKFQAQKQHFKPIYHKRRRKVMKKYFKRQGYIVHYWKVYAKQQLAFLGHVLRRQSLENLVVRGRIDGRRARGRQRLQYLDSLCNSLKDKVSPTQRIRASEDRGLWQRMVANVVDDGTTTWHDMTDTDAWCLCS